MRALSSARRKFLGQPFFLMQHWTTSPSSTPRFPQVQTWWKQSWPPRIVLRIEWTQKLQLSFVTANYWELWQVFDIRCLWTGTGDLCGRVLVLRCCLNWACLDLPIGLLKYCALNSYFILCLKNIYPIIRRKRKEIHCTLRISLKYAFRHI